MAGVRLDQSQEPGLFQVSCMGTRAQPVESSFIAFPGAITGIWIRNRVAGTETGTIWDVGAAGGGLMCYSTTPAPVPSFFRKILRHVPQLSSDISVVF